MARLVVINKTLARSAHELGDGWATIGRGNGNAFQIVERSVSGRHCEVRLISGDLQVRDLNSTNGTLVDGHKIDEAFVKPGQILQLGDVQMRFEASVPATPKPAANSPAPVAVAVPAPVPVASAPAPAPVPTPTVAVKPPVVVALSEGDTQKKFQVLFVDDSLAFLESFGGLCTEFSQGKWQIHTASSADRALTILQECTMDLVVLDVGMPMLDGLQLLGIINRRFPGMKIAVMTGNATEDKRTDALANGAELFLEKPVTVDGIKAVFNMLNDLVSWHREGFTGALRHVGLTEVIQMECNGRHSSILEIRNSELRGQIFIEVGTITHAAVGPLLGEKAFYRLLSLKGGEFQVKPFKSPPQRTIENRWEFLLMDAARAADEEAGDAKKTVTLPTPTEHAAMSDDMVVVATYDGKWKPGDGEKK